MNCDELDDSVVNETVEESELDKIIRKNIYYTSPYYKSLAESPTMMSPEFHPNLESTRNLL